MSECDEFNTLLMEGYHFHSLFCILIIKDLLMRQENKEHIQIKVPPNSYHISSFLLCACEPKTPSDYELQIKR